MASLYSDGNPRAISWAIRTPQETLLQRREQAGIYHDSITPMQARFVALHVGLFWGIGVFAIQNGGTVRFMIDDPAMMSHLESRCSGDAFIDGRMRSIDLLVKQRGLDLSVHRIEQSENVATPLLEKT
jgi:hypothetical protein